MAPIPQENVPQYDSNPPHEDGNRIVISGMSGLYPRAHSVKEFADILYNKVNPVTHDDLRYNCKHPEVAQHSGSIPTLGYFDAQFFRVNYRVASAMDPMGMKVLEQTYHAIYDAGLNPEYLSGKKVGVYIAAGFSDSETLIMYKPNTQGFAMPGCSKSMFANRISYWLNAKGPSMTIDAACCGSTTALELAFQAINRGDCEAAIIGATCICLSPNTSLQYGRILDLCDDGKTKSFDQRACGCAKSEAINVLFLQKAKDALRIYAELTYVKTEFIGMPKLETGPKYGFYRDLNMTKKFLESFYDEASVSPQSIEYVEAFGSAIPEVDKVELQSIEDVFGKTRDNPLLVGSVMSNIGYGEATSGISAITKVLLGYHSGQLAANLHYQQPRKDIKSLCDGRMRIVDEPQFFDRSYVAVNGMSLTGMNFHVLLHGNYKPKNINRYSTSIPHLVTLSGRHTEAVQYAINVMKTSPVDPEQLALLHNIHQQNISGHTGRGFIVLRTDEEDKTITLCEKADYFDDKRRPLWFVYSGMGSQWAGMGKELMQIPIFAAAIEKCHNALETKGVDIINIVTSHDESVFDNILHAFVGIAAIQIGLTDILYELGLKPDGIIGHSLGEQGCGYADGCLNVEDTMLCAYYRGLVSITTEFIHGSMAAVGMGYEQLSKICPPEIEVACHNGPDSSTISGPSNIMNEFLAKLKAEAIFSKEVPCSNIAYHSRYIANAEPALLKNLQDVIKSPKARSERWLSTSIPQDKWKEPLAKCCSAEYLTNNLLSSVLFEETSRLIPHDALLVEVAPHGLLQAILKRSMPSSCKNIPLTRRYHPNATVLLLEAIGKLYLEGYNSKVQVLYPKVEMPVSTGTPFLSHLVKWVYDEKWHMPRVADSDRRIATSCNLIISLHDQEYSYLRGHCIRGYTSFPFAASIILVWDVLAMIQNMPKKGISVKFNDLKFYTQPLLHDWRQLKLRVSIQKGNGYFEVMDGISKVVTGFINPLTKPRPYISDNQNNNMYFNAQDIYQLLRDRDYFYSNEFRSIASVDKSLSVANLIWRDNWITFVDGMLQLNALHQPHHAVSQPSSIGRLIIDIQQPSMEIMKLKGENLIQAHVSEKYKTTRCGGVVLENIKFQQLPSYIGINMNLKSLSYVPYFTSGLDVSTSLEVYFQIVADNLSRSSITVVGLRQKGKEGYMFKALKNVLQNLYKIKVNYKQIHGETEVMNYKLETVDVILIENLSFDKNKYEYLQEAMQQGKYVVSEDYVVSTPTLEATAEHHVLAVHTTNHETKLQLIRWGPRVSTDTKSVSDKHGREYYLSMNQPIIKNRNVKLEGPPFGDSNSLKWVNIPERKEPGIAVNVHYVGINEKDIQQTNGNLLFKSNNDNFGMDFSGITNSGDLVMGIVLSGAASSKVRVRPELLWPVPSHWSLEDAATVPLAYMQAFYCLRVRAKLREGKSILVHGGAGALGQAIISIALALNCEVYATVRDKSKKSFLCKLFPELKADHIGCSRDHSFSEMVQIVSKGKKCDIIVSCTKGNMKDVTFLCLAPEGLFLDISQLQNDDDFSLGMSSFTLARHYATIEFSSIFETNNMQEILTLHKMVTEGINRGYVRPLSRVTYAAHDVGHAFRFRATSSHRGRVLLQMKENAIQTQYRLGLSSDHSNLILCGKTNFGLDFVDRLVSRGAKQLYLHVQTDAAYIKHKIRTWQQLGVKVNTSSECLNDQKAIVTLLTNSLRMGPLEGVYIIAEETDTGHNMITNLDAEIRNMSIDLSYFVGIYFGENSTGKKVFLDRISDQLPATVLVLPEIKEIAYNSSTNWRAVVNAAEQSLQNTRGVMLAYENRHKSSLLQEIAKVAELTVPENIAKSRTLKDLGIPNHKLQLLSTFLRVQYNLAFEEEQILSLTIKMLMEIERNLIKLPCEDVQGLSTFFAYVDPDELLATAEVVFMPTLNSTNYTEGGITEKSHINLCIIPGMEGHHERFRALCRRLKLRALVLQPGFDYPHETVAETAQRYAEVLLRKTGMKNTFYLMGYESGIPVALETAALLEDHGLTGTVFCLGYTPKDLVSEIEEQLLAFPDEKKLQDGVLRHMYSLMTEEDTSVLDDALQNLSTWSQKVDVCVHSLLSQHSAQYTRSLIDCALARIQQTRQFSEAFRPLRSQVILLRAAMRQSSTLDTSLEHISQQPLVVCQLDTPFAHILTDLRCATLINEHVHPAILEKFTNKNRCDTYDY